jgi:parallel beta-helix repeat protein
VDIPKGRLVIEDCDISSGALSCVAIHGPTADPLIRRCTIRHGRESGVLVDGIGQCTLEECDISGNAVGVAIRRYACPTIRRCRVHGSSSYGIHTEDYAEGVVEACEIRDNGQAGVYIDRGSMLSLIGCTISRNERAVAVASDGGGTVQGCDLSGNTLGAWSVMHGAEAWLQRAGNRE